MTTRDQTPVVLTIAGTDPSGGAGINVDLQVFRDHDCHGTAAVTAVVWQNTQTIGGWRPVEPEELGAQLEAVGDDFCLDALKIGMVPTADLVSEVARFVTGLQPGVDVVLDPVMMGGRGERDLMTSRGRRALSGLRDGVDLVTPNAPESRRLLGATVERPEAIVEALKARGWKRVLLKGGHFPSGDRPGMVDWYGDQDGIRATKRLEAVDGDVRGTGCQLSSAVAARRALGHSWEEAVERGRAYLNELLHCRAQSIGDGRPIVVRTGGKR